LLTSRLGDSGKGIAVSPKVGKITLREALQAVIDDQRTRGRKSIDATQRRIDLHVLPYFGPDRRMSTISGQDIESYRAFRMTEQKASLASTNRELAVLRRAFRPESLLNCVLALREEIREVLKATRVHH